MADQVLDLRGLNCPVPILRARRALKNLPAGATLQVFATDPSAGEDFETYCRTSGNELVECKRENDVFSVLIKRKF